MYFLVISLCVAYATVDAGSLPLVVSTWAQSYFPKANEKAWSYLINVNDQQPLAALVEGLTTCEDLQCDHTVGFGGSPDENGETTLDALVMDGTNHQMGGIGALRRIKAAGKVAWAVMNYTEHSFLVGDQATEFAVHMGFPLTNLTTNFSIEEDLNWRKNACQPNFWRDDLRLSPNPKHECGPYNLTSIISNKTIRKPTKDEFKKREIGEVFDQKNHDTLGMVVIDKNSNVVAGTTTNGANHKIAGRVGDSPIPGAGAYADEFGAAAETGDGDVMMRFLPSFLSVEKMRDGCTPTEATQIAILRVQKFFPNFMGAIVAANKYGDYGAACNWLPYMHNFTFCVASPDTGNTTLITIDCLKNGAMPPTCQKSSSSASPSSSPSASPTSSAGTSYMGFSLYHYLFSWLFL